MDSDSSDWGSDCVVQQVQAKKPLITLEKQSNHLDFHNDLLINQYESLRSPTFTQSTQINLNFTLNRNSKFITELNVIQNINDNLQISQNIDFNNLINLGIKDQLSQLYLYILNDSYVDIKTFLPTFTQTKILNLSQDDLIVYLNIMKLLIKYCDKQTLTIYQTSFQNIIGILQQHKFQMYAKVVFNIALLDNIDLLSDEDVKRTTINVKHIMNECFLIENLFDVVAHQQQYVLVINHKEPKSFFDLTVLFEIVQALVCIINYVTPVTYKVVQDDFLLRIVRRYIFKQKSHLHVQKNPLASASLDSDIDQYTIQLGDQQLKLVEAIGNSLSCCSLLLSMSQIRYPVEILQNLLFPCELASQYIKDYFSNQESDTLLLTEPTSSLYVYQSIEIIADLSQAGFYSLNVLQQVAQNIESFNQLKVSLIKPLLSKKAKQEKFQLIQQIYSLLQDLGDFDSILQILLQEYQFDKSPRLALLIADAFAQILQFGLAQYFYCQALCNMVVIHDVRGNFKVENIQDLEKFPKTAESLNQLKELKISDDVENSEQGTLSACNTIQFDLEVNHSQMDIYIKRVECYVKANKIQSSIQILQQLIKKQEDKQILLQLQSQLCRIYIKNGCNSVFRVKQQFLEFENSIVEHLKANDLHMVIDSIQYFMQFLLKNQQFATVLLICQLLRLDTRFSEKQKTLVLLYEVHALSYMNGLNISFYATQSWNENLLYPINVVENLQFGKDLLNYLIQKTQSGVLMKAYSMVFSFDEAQGQLRFVVQERNFLIGLFIYSAFLFLQKSSYQINIDKIIELKIHLLHFMMDKQKQDGETRKVIQRYSLKFKNEDGFSFQPQDNYIIDTQSLKKILQSLTFRPCFNLFQNLHILILYLKYWLINDPKNKDIQYVFDHCIETIISTFILNNNVIFVIYPSKLQYLYQIYQILQLFLELLLISKQKFTDKIYNLIDAYIILEKQIENTQTHEFWPEILIGFKEIDQKQLMILKKERLYSHSFMPEVVDFYEQDNLKSVKIEKLMSQIIKIYDNLILQQLNYQYQAKSYNKRQRIFSGNNGHLVYTIYEENTDVLQYQTNEFYKQQIQQYFRLVQDLKSQFKQIQGSDYKAQTGEVLVILKINNFIYFINQYKVERIFELSNCHKEDNQMNNQSFYNEFVINSVFQNREQMNVSKFIQLLTMLNTTCKFPYEPEILLNNFIDIPLNKTALFLIVQYLQSYFGNNINFTELLISFQLQFIPFEKIFDKQLFRRIISLQNNVWQRQNRKIHLQKISRLTDITSSVNRQASCTIKDDQIFKVKDTNFKVFGNKFKGSKQTLSIIQKFFFKFVGKVIIHQNQLTENNEDDIQRRFYNKQNLMLQFGSTCSKSEFSYSQQQLFLFRNELLVPNKKVFLPYFSKLQKKISIFDQTSIGYQQGVTTPKQQLQELSQLETDEQFIELIKNSKTLQEISTDPNCYSLKFVDIHLFTLADYYEMTDTIVALLSKYQNQLLLFVSGRDYATAAKVLTQSNIINTDFDQFCNEVVQVVQRGCFDTIIFSW